MRFSFGCSAPPPHVGSNNRRVLLAGRELSKTLKTTVVLCSVRVSRCRCNQSNSAVTNFPNNGWSTQSFFGVREKTCPARGEGAGRWEKRIYLFGRLARSNRTVTSAQTRETTERSRIRVVDTYAFLSRLGRETKRGKNRPQNKREKKSAHNRVTTLSYTRHPTYYTYTETAGRVSTTRRRLFRRRGYN